ncbi:polyisoprenoid-binding protein YceI [Constrictibacter sp. MBR-5]|jgi:polyisoprenoid-binding protein YceI|uniref:YceI family protein n=1 Tax=Constrictibacter sp. MBR-5 TaxID=3156467 RepID=UPI00339555FA
MRQSLAIAAAFLSIGAAAPAAAADFKLDPDHTMAVFVVNHLGYSNMIGRFNDVSGTFSFDPATPEKAKISMAIDTASVDTDHKRRDDHLRGPDFFNAQEFPQMTFESTKVEVTGERTGKVTGDLTLLGVTKPVTLDVTFNKMEPHPLPPYNKVLTAGFSVRGTIKRSDFGMTYFLPAVGDEIQLMLEVEGAETK